MRTRNPAVVDRLLAAGTRVDVPDRDGRLPLREAAMNGYVDILQSLLAAKAEVDQRNTFGETALLAACRNGRSQIVAILLAAGADPALRNDVDVDALEMTRTSAGMPEQERRNILALFAAHAARRCARQALDTTQASSSCLR